jgi:hypothetical protein
MDSGFQAFSLQKSWTSAVSFNLIRVNELYRFDVKKQRIQGSSTRTNPYEGLLR